MKLVWILVVISQPPWKPVITEEFKSRIACEWIAYSEYYSADTECVLQWVYDV